MAIKEKPFPRGGSKPAFRSSSKNPSFSLFGKTNKSKKTKKKIRTQKQKENKSVKVRKIKSTDPTNVQNIEELNPSGVHEGMVVLGIVSQVTEKIINLSLPGSLKGIITLPNMPEFYKEKLKFARQQSEIFGLRDLFKPGDVLPVKIVAVSEENYSLILTCDPHVINSKLSCDLLEKGLVLCGNVVSKEDYGYVIDTGIQHVHAFLHFDKANEGVNLKVGQIVRCVIINCNKSSGSCNLQLSMLTSDFQTTFLGFNSNFPMIGFTPGFQFEVSINKVLRNGIEVSCNHGNTTKGYIHEDYLLNKFPKLSDIEVGSHCIATLLYVKPYVNIPFFKIMPKKPMELPFQYGEIVSGRVIQARKTGLIVKVINGKRKAKCFIPMSKLKNTNKIVNNDMSIENLYPVNKKIPKIRLRTFNYMGRYYLGATNKESLEEKYFSITDLKCGEILTATISSFEKNCVKLKIGNTITGIVDFIDVTDVPIRNPQSRFKVEQEVKARVMEVIPETKCVRLTMKPTLLKTKRILCDTNFKMTVKYTGVIISVMNDKLLIKFFNGVIGTVHKQLTPYPDVPSLSSYFSKGQLVKCFVLHVKENNELALSMLECNLGSHFKIGKKYKAVVVNISEKGILLDVQLKKNKTCNGYLPKELLTIHQSLAGSLLSCYSIGTKMTVYCVSNNTTFGLPVMGNLEIFKTFYEGKTTEDMSNLLAVNSILPFLYKNKNVKSNQMFLNSLIPMTNHMVIRAQAEEKKRDQRMILKSYQPLYGKVLVLTKNKMSVSLKLSDVWDKDFHVSLDLLDSYLITMKNLINYQKSKLGIYSANASMGLCIKGVIEEVRTSHAIVRTDDGDLGLVEGKFTKGQIINGVIAWIDVVEQMIHIAANVSSSFENHAKGETPFEPEWLKLHGKIIYSNDEVAVVQLKGKGKGKLAYIPRRRHLNDMEHVESPFLVGDEISVWVTTKESKYLLAMDNRIVASQEKVIWKKSQNKLKESIVSLKRKLQTEKIERTEKRRKKESESDDLEIVETKLKDKLTDTESKKSQDLGFGDVKEIKQEIDVDDNDEFNCTYNSVPYLEYDDIEVKSEEEEYINDEASKSKPYNTEKISLSSSSESEDEQEDNSGITKSSRAFEVGFKWEVMKDNALLSGVVLNKDEESSSDDEDADTKNDKKKRRKLTESEKLEQAKTEEQRLRLIEERLMDPDREPETVDDFDRAVLSNPDSSALWLKYMAFHVQNTEIEQAKSVARRALKAISFREEQEKLNVWIALLNLESLYGNEESLNKTLGEALQYNEPYKIHLHMLNLYGKSNKLQDMEKLGNFMLKKYKDVENMWEEVGTAYFVVGKVESARLVLQRALTILGKKQQVLLVSKFAQMENKYGSPERAQTLYESILGSFPKRVDIWSCYVDMLVKSKQIDLARQVLERATSQSLRPRKMKTLFKKFLTFEETFGTPENVEKVREAAVDYVQTVGSLTKR